MRNLFDQYFQPENRVTHALMTALNEDRRLLGRFLRELVKVTPPVRADKLLVLEQRYPGEDEPGEAELERRGVPDGWIFDDDGWCVFIETKVLIPLRAAQIESHRRTAARRGFRSITAVAISPYRLLAPPAGTVVLEWRAIYAWLRGHGRESAWAHRAAEYLEIAEAKMIEAEQFREGTLTTFSGFPFTHDHAFTYLEGKRVLGLALDELRRHKDLGKRLGMNPAVRGRPAITGRQSDTVWDFLSLSTAADAQNFTKYPHLTLGITSGAVEAMVTVPNSVNAVMKRNLKELGETGFQDVVAEVLANLKPLLRKYKGAQPWFRGIQRRYPSQRATPHMDARIDFDLRTAVPGGGPPKAQPRWLSAAYGSFVQKNGANYQMQIGVHFRYDRCPELREPQSIRLIADTWLACKPLADLHRPKRRPRKRKP